jgi:hypothetical protein
MGWPLTIWIREETAGTEDARAGRLVMILLLLAFLGPILAILPMRLAGR